METDIVKSLLVLVAIGLSLGCGALLGRLHPGRTARCLATGVWAPAFLVVAMQALGCCSALTGLACVSLLPLVCVLAVACVGCWLLTHRRRRDTGSAGDARPPAQSGFERLRGRRLMLPAVLGAAALTLLVSAFLSGLLAPPRGWDVLSYHLPRAAAWLQDGALRPYGGNTAHYPGNGELLLLTLLFSGSDRLVPVVQVPFALLSGLAVYGTSRLIGGGRRSAAVAALCVLLMPIVVFQTAIAKNDLVALAGTTCGMYFALAALRPRPDGSARYLLVGTAGVALGMAAGSRYPSLPLAFAIALLPALAALARASDARTAADRTRDALALAGVGVGSLLLPSAFWLLSNWVQAGNPFAPYAVGIGSLELWGGITPLEVYGEQQFHYVESARDWWWFLLRDRALWGSYSANAGFGAVAASLILPSSLWMLARSLRRAGACGRRLLPLLVLGVSAVALLTWLASGSRLPRYVLPAVVLPMPALALLLDSCKGLWRRSLEIVVIVAVAFSSLETVRVFHADEDVTSAYLGSVSKNSFYRMPGWVYALPPGTKIALTPATEHQYYQTFRYPLVGRLPGNSVVMQGDVGTSFHILSDGPRGMHENLLADGVDYLFMRTFDMEPYITAFDQNPDLYELILDTVEDEYPWYRIGGPIVTKVYRVLDNQTQGWTLDKPTP